MKSSQASGPLQHSQNLDATLGMVITYSLLHRTLLPKDLSLSNPEKQFPEYHFENSQILH
jgi:hypothetical protein